MKPKKPDNFTDLFRSQLSQMLNMSHPLIKLSQRMNWSKLEAEIDVMYSDNAGQPPLPTRLLVSLHYRSMKATKALLSAGLRTRIGNTSQGLSTCNMSYHYTRRV